MSATATESALDRSLQSVSESPDQEHLFYNEFLNTELFLPTHNTPEQDNEYRAGEGTTISPFFIEANGKQYLMLFDSKERLAEWAQREVGFVRLPGHAIVEMMDPSIYWFLNYGTPYEKQFIPEEIRWLQASLEKTKLETDSAQKGTTILAGKPKTIPDGLVASLNRVASRNSEVSSAALGLVYIEGEMEKPSLALALKLTQVAPSVEEAILHEFGVASRGYFSEDEQLLVVVSEKSAIANDVFQSVDPFFER